MGNILGKSKTQSIGEHDVVVFLVGAAGAGKSTFMGAFDKDRRTHRNIRSLDPSTKDVQAWTYKFEQFPNNIVLVDTPSFHTEHDFDAEDIMRKWMKASKFSRCRCSGILYLHNLAGNPDERGLLIQKHLDTFAETFPRKCSVPGRVYIVPTMDRGLIPGSGIAKRHYPRLQTATGSLHAKWNASMFRQNFRDEPDIAYNAVQSLLQDIARV